MHEEGKQRKRLTKNIFFSSSWLSHVTSFTSFSPPPVSLRQTSNTIFFSSVCSCQFNLDGCTCRHRLRLIRLEYTWSKKHLHSPPHTQLHSVSCTPWHKYTLFHFKKSWLQGCSHVFLYIVCSLTLSVSVHPSPPGTLDYISACVRPGDVFTQIISFISCASIHPPMCPFTPPPIHPFLWAFIGSSLHAGKNVLLRQLIFSFHTWTCLFYRTHFSALMSYILVSGT